MIKLHNLKSQREAAGLTQIDLAEKLGISRQTLQNYECGKVVPKQERLEQLSEAINEAKKQVKMSKLVIDLNAQAREILKRAEEKGIEHAYMFKTTFNRYQQHINHLIQLEKELKKHGNVLVTKEYVKGRGNIYVHPALNAYNSTAGAADKTAQMLMRYIVTPLASEDEPDEFDAF